MSGFRPVKGSLSSLSLKKLINSPKDNTKQALTSFTRPIKGSNRVKQLSQSKHCESVPVLNQSLERDIDRSQLAVPISQASSICPSVFQKQDSVFSNQTSIHSGRNSKVQKKCQGREIEFTLIKKDKAKMMRNIIYRFRKKMSHRHKNFNKLSLTKKVLEVIKRSKIVSTELNYRVILLSCNLEKIDKALSKI